MKEPLAGPEGGRKARAQLDRPLRGRDARVCGVPTERRARAVWYPERCSGLVYGVPLGHRLEVNCAKMRQVGG